MSLSTTKAIYLAVGLLDFGGILICWCISVYLVYTKLEIILHHLKNCDIGSHRLYLNMEVLRGKIWILSSVIFALTLPNFHIRHKKACMKDLHNFPIRLKRKLVIHQSALWILTFVMFVQGAIAWLDLI